jgi:hypothetical protein
MRTSRPAFIFVLSCIVVLLSSDVSSELTKARVISLSSKDAMSAWTQPKGQFYNHLTYSYQSSDHKFTTIATDEEGIILDVNSDVMRVETSDFNAQIATYHGEYGVTDSLTVYATVPWVNTEYEDIIRFSDGDGPEDVGDIHIGLRYNLFKNIKDSKVDMSVQGDVKIPEAYEYSNPLTYVNIGDGQYDTTVTLLFGRIFNKGYSWANIGYRFRFENDKLDPLAFEPSDQLKVSFGGGYDITSKLTIRGLIDWTKSMRNASVSDELIKENWKFGGIGGYGDTILIQDTLGLQQDILNLGIAVDFDITDQIRAILSYNSDIEGFNNFGTKNAAQVTTYSLAIVLML